MRSAFRIPMFVALIAVAGFTGSAQAQETPPFCDVTATHLPPFGRLAGLSMDAGAADFDGDGDIDLIIATEFRSNILLINDGTGMFADRSSSQLPNTVRDSEDVAIADFDGDGDLDIVVASEDDLDDEFYINDGFGFFASADERLPVRARTNAVIAADVDGDGDPDLVLANNGLNSILINDGTGHFTDETRTRLELVTDVSQDIDAGDIDGDGDLDLAVANEGSNRILVNDGTGVFTDETRTRLAHAPGVRETREIDFGDIDGDGDLDILTANVRFFVADAILVNRLLINKGHGVFSDETETRLPQHEEHTVDGDFIDIDDDGDLDIVTANTNSLRRGSAFRILVNIGGGNFREVTEQLFPSSPQGVGFDVEAADYNGDGRLDFYFAVRDGQDLLVLRSGGRCP